VRILPPLLALVSLIALPAGPGQAAPPAAAPTPPPATGTVALRAQPPQPQTVVEADEIAYDSATNTVTARGNVRVTHPQFRLFADSVTYDLTGQVITAEGRARLIDTQGRELRGRRIVYDVTREEATLTDGETIIDRVYLRAAQVQARRDRLTVQEAMVTICDPTRPLYRITARRVEVTPGKELVAHDASIWLGSVRVLTLSAYRVPLDRPAGPPLPSVGSDATDGIWIDYRYPYRWGELDGEAYVKYGTISGFFGLNTLTYRGPAWSAALALGRTQRSDPDGVLHALTQGEISASAAPWRIGGTPLALSGRAAFGWFDELDSGVATTRAEGAATLAGDVLALGPQTTVSAAMGYRWSAYGTGAQRTVLSGNVALTHRFTDATTATLRYDHAQVGGATPFLFDRVDPTRTLALTVAHVRPDYRISAGVSRDFTVPETKLQAAAGLRVAPSVFFDVSAVYNLRTQAFEDIDYTVTYRCDCLSVAVQYRQVRGEISVQFAFFPSDRLALTQPP